jgi:hypothetical protein
MCIPEPRCDAGKCKVRALLSDKEQLLTYAEYP